MKQSTLDKFTVAIIAIQFIAAISAVAFGGFICYIAWHFIQKFW